MSIAELVSNCVTNRVPGLDAGAKRIEIKFGTRELTVRDDFVYEDPEEILQRLRNIIASGRPKTTKLPDPDLGYPLGGMGIFTIVQALREHDGELSYFTENGTIVSKIKWEKD